MKKILVVDNDQHIQNLFKLELEEEGYTVYQADCGIEGLKLFNEVNPDIVILDILMPDIDGIQVLIEMKEKNPNIPIIMSSAYDYRDDSSVWASEAYVVKSSDHEELKATIRKLLREKNEDFTEYRKPKQLSDEELIRLVKRIKFLDKSIGIEDYGKKIEKELDSLHKAIVNTHEAINMLMKNKDNHFQKLSDTLKLIIYSKLLTENYRNIFFNIIPELSQVSIAEIVDEVLSVLTLEEINFKVNREFNFNGMILNDTNILQLITFVILKNLNDFFYDMQGTITIKINNFSDTDTCEIKFQFSNVRHSLKSDKKKILLVDDDKYMLELLSQTFGDYNYSIFLASNGYDCLDMIRDNTFSLIVLDMKMAGMEGLEVLESLRRSRKSKHIPVIIYSSYSEVTEPSFIKKISVFNPVETLEKSSDKLDYLVNIAYNMINQYCKPFSFRDIFYLDLEEAIVQDQILMTGFVSVRKVLVKINGRIDFEDSDDTQSIILKIPSKVNLKTIQSDTRVEDSKVKAYFLEKLNEHFRHDLKNKLLPIKNDLEDVDILTVSDQQKEQIELIKKNVDQCIELLDRIKNIPLG